MSDINDIEITSPLEEFCAQANKGQAVWLLEADDGGLLSISSAYDENQDVILVWGERDLAQAQTQQQWQGFSAFAISLDEFINDLAPDLANDDVLLGVNYQDTACAEIGASQLVGKLTDID